MKADMAERLVLNRRRLEEEHARLLEAQAQVRHMPCPMGIVSCYFGACLVRSSKGGLWLSTVDPVWPVLKVEEGEGKQRKQTPLILVVFTLQTTKCISLGIVKQDFLPDFLRSFSTLS